MNEQIQNYIDEQIKQNELLNQYSVNNTSFHTHNGTDSLRVEFGDISNKTQVINHVLFGASPATTANYSAFMTIPFSCYITGITEVHTTAGSDGSAVTLQIEKLTTTQAPGAGVEILTTGFNLKGTANTVQTGVLSIYPDRLQLEVGNRLALKLTGTPTAVANLAVTITIQF